jgi:hypothetical protein
MRIIYTYILFVFVAISLNAQTVYWQLQPREYSSIERIGKGLYKIASDNKVGVMNQSGEMIVPLEYDGIERFYEDLALVINKEGTREIVAGTLEKAGKFNRFEETFYAIPNQEFYSEGLLTVVDNNKRLGYINPTGNRVCGFESSLSYIKPFVEGYAAIFRGKNIYQLISPKGEACTIVLGISEVYGGTNMYNGSAVVWDTNGKVYEYFPSTRQVTRIKRPSSMDYDYLFRFKAITKGSNEIPYQEVEPGKEGISPTSEEGKLGFGIMMPPQFTFATPFVDDISIVQIDGKYGLLRYSETGSPISAFVEQSELSYKPNQRVTCGFKLNIPQEWDNQSLKILVDGRLANETVDVSYKSGLCTFDVSPKDENQLFRVKVRNDMLVLWEGDIKYRFKKIDPIKNANMTLRLVNDRANSEDRCVVECSITNPNDVELSTTVNITGTDNFERKTQVVDIPPHSTVKLSTYFIVKKILQNQSVTATTDKGGTAKLTGLDLIPFNIDG